MSEIPIAFIDDNNDLYESKDYVDFQLEDKDKEIEILNNIIANINKQLDTLEEINEKYEVGDTDSLYSKKWLKETIEEMRQVINGRNE